MKNIAVPKKQEYRFIDEEKIIDKKWVENVIVHE